MGRSVIELDKDSFLSAAFKKVQKFEIGLNIARFFKEIDSKRLEGSCLYERFFVYIFHLERTFTHCLLVGFLSRSSDNLSCSLRSGIL